VLFIRITRLASNEIFSPSNKIQREVGRSKDLSAPMLINVHENSSRPFMVWEMVEPQTVLYVLLYFIL
jgi:hypothetical protein